MTIEEAIQELKDASDSEVRHGDTEYHYEEVMKRVEAFGMAINNLNKEIPKNVTQPKELVRYGMGERYDDYGCPSCGTFLASEPEGNRNKGKLSRCWKCGQIVEW